MFNLPKSCSHWHFLDLWEDKSFVSLDVFFWISFVWLLELVLFFPFLVFHIGVFPSKGFNKARCLSSSYFRPLFVLIFILFWLGGVFSHPLLMMMMMM